MNNDSRPDPDGQAICEKQEAWNNNYYAFFNGWQRASTQFTQLLPALFDRITALIQANRTVEALGLLNEFREHLITNCHQEIQLAQKHHGYVNQAMGNYKVMAEMLRDYSLARDDRELADCAATQLVGIDHFWLAAIADLDPERA
jgi:hypothetical protein